MSYIGGIQASDSDFPLLVVLTFLLLVAADVNGSSVGALVSGPDSNLIAGTPQVDVLMSTSTPHRWPST